MSNFFTKIVANTFVEFTNDLFLTLQNYLLIGPLFNPELISDLARGGILVAETV